MENDWRSQKSTSQRQPGLRRTGPLVPDETQTAVPQAIKTAWSANDGVKLFMTPGVCDPTLVLGGVCWPCWWDSVAKNPLSVAAQLSGNITISQYDIV